MKHFNVGLRILFGLHYFVFGFNKIIVFYEMKAVNPFAQQVIDSFYSTGYLMEAVGVFQIFSGLLILLNKFFPFALVLAFPITLNIALYSIFTHNQSVTSTGIELMVIFANIYFIVLNRKKYYPLFENSEL